MNEADTCQTSVLPKLKSTSWEDEYITEQRMLTPGRLVAHLNNFPLSRDLQQVRLASLRELQSTTSDELSAVPPIFLDKTFKGEL
jgi:hypothetical protein